MTEFKTPKLKVLGYRCLIRIDVPVLAGGLVRPELSEVEKKRGTVVGLGDGRVNDTNVVLPFSVKVGDLVLLGPYAQFEYTEDGVLYVVCAAQDIIGKIDPVPFE